MDNLRRTRYLRLLPALVLVALAIPSAAYGQATRTWVSGVGDDVNPCSRTAPCKTFAGAISKTARGGIINALDDGGFGSVTITKSITIDGGHHIASVLSSGVNGVIVNVTDFANDPRAKVVLRNLDIAGNTNLGPPASALGINGVRFISGKSLKIANTTIHDFAQNGVDFKNTNAGVSRLVLKRSDVDDNDGNGLAVAPGNGAISVATVRNTSFDGNTCGVVASQFGIGTSGFATNCAAGAPNGGTGTAIINVFDSGFSGNTGSGALSNGANALVRLSNNDVMGNGFGLHQVNNGVVKSFGNNHFGDNGADGVPNGPNLTTLKR
ncbi:MAG: right-handed parallel beta-helix repeat-containing protein [Thermoleophilaceae bacterium]